MFELAYPWLLTLLPAPLFVWMLLPPHREVRDSLRIPFLEQVAHAAGASPASGGLVARRNVVQKFLLPLIWLLLLVAAARPQLVEPPISKVESARDLMLAVDLSGSMSQRDMTDAEGVRATRMDAVKEVLDGFIARREGDRIGVVVFGTQAFVQTPFTQDHDLVRALLDQVEPRMPGPQTMIGDAIGLTIKIFEESEARDRVLVLLTDGADTGSRVPPQRAAEIAAEEGITIHTVTMGDPNSTGAGRIDLESMTAVARATGGSAFTALDRDGLAGIYDEIDALTPEEIETITYRPTRPLYHLPMGAAVGLVLLYHLVTSLATGVKRLATRDA